MNNNKYRAEWIDFAKGITITLMVYYHVCEGLKKRGILLLSPDSEWFMFNELLATWRMPLLLFLAGLMFRPCLEKYGGRGLLTRRMGTVVYPYVVWMLLHGTLMLHFSGFTNRQVGLQQVLKLWEPTHHYWFLYSLFWLTLISVLVYKLVPWKYSILVALAGASLYLWGHKVLPFVNPLPYLFFTAVFFMLGIWFTPLMQWFSTNAPRVAAPVVVFAIAIQSVLYEPKLGIGNPQALMLALVGVFTVGVLAVCLSQFKSLKFVAKVGSVSLVIYVAHVLFTAFSREVLMKLLKVNDLTIHLVLGMTAGVVGPYVLWQVSQRLGWMWLFEPPAWLAKVSARLAAVPWGKPLKNPSKTL